MLDFTENEKVLTDTKIPLDRSACDPREILDARRLRMQNILDLKGENGEGEDYQVLCYNFWTPMNNDYEEVATSPLVFMDRTTMGGNMYNVDEKKGEVYIPEHETFFYDNYQSGQTKIYTDRLNKFGRGYVFQTTQNKKNPNFSPMTAALHSGAETGLPQ